MNTVYKHDIIAIFDQAISSIEDKIPEAKRLERQAKSKLNKAKHMNVSRRNIEKHRQDYYAASLEVGTWERRLKIANTRREKALVDSGYYKVGGSC